MYARVRENVPRTSPRLAGLKRTRVRVRPRPPRRSPTRVTVEVKLGATLRNMHTYLAHSQDLVRYRSRLSHRGPAVTVRNWRQSARRYGCGERGSPRSITVVKRELKRTWSAMKMRSGRSRKPHFRDAIVPHSRLLRDHSVSFRAERGCIYY